MSKAVCVTASISAFQLTSFTELLDFFYQVIVKQLWLDASTVWKPVE